MSLLAQLKKDSMLARKAADSVRATLLSTLIGEAEMVGKNAGNRESTDDEVQQTIRKFLKNNQEALGVIKDAERRAVLEQESAILTDYRRRPRRARPQADGRGDGRTEGEVRQRLRCQAGQRLGQGCAGLTALPAGATRVWHRGPHPAIRQPRKGAPASFPAA